MKVSTITGKHPLIDTSFAVLESALEYAPSVCLADVTSPASGAGVAFQIPHTLGITPQFVLATPYAAGDSLGHTASERSTWGKSFVTVHASAASARFTVLIGTLERG